MRRRARAGCLLVQLAIERRNGMTASEHRPHATTAQEGATLCRLYVVTLLIPTVRPTHAQTWPEKPVKQVVAYPPGGGTDTLACVVADRLRYTFRQAFIVEKRPGAGRMLGAG